MNTSISTCDIRNTFDDAFAEDLHRMWMLLACQGGPRAAKSAGTGERRTADVETGEARA